MSDNVAVDPSHTVIIFSVVPHVHSNDAHTLFVTSSGMVTVRVVHNCAWM